MPGARPNAPAAEQTDIHRWIASLNQTLRMFGHHRNDDQTTPEEPSKRIGDGKTDEELTAELEELERELDDF